MSSSASPPAPQVAEKSDNPVGPLHVDPKNPETAQQSASTQSGGVDTSASESETAVDAPFDVESFRTYKDYLRACKKRGHVTPQSETCPFPASVGLPPELRRGDGNAHGVPYRSDGIIVRKEGHAILVCLKTKVTLIKRSLSKSTEFHHLELFVKEKATWSHAYVGSFLPLLRTFPFNPQTIKGFPELDQRPDLKNHWDNPYSGRVFVVLNFVRFNTDYLNALRKFPPPPAIRAPPPAILPPLPSPALSCHVHCALPLDGRETTRRKAEDQGDDSRCLKRRKL